MEYIRKHNPETEAKKLILFPNTVKVTPLLKDGQDIKARKDTVSFVFGGNLGKPQAVDFLIRVINSKRLRACRAAKFLFVGNGSERDKVKAAFANSPNAEFIDFMPPAEYRELMRRCDVGMISLDARFTIPNYPSRALSYMAEAKPILACTDRNTDIRELLTEEADCGLWCASDDEEAFCENVERLCRDEGLREQLGNNGRRYLEEHFDVSRSVGLIEQYGCHNKKETMEGRDDV